MIHPDLVQTESDLALGSRRGDECSPEMAWFRCRNLTQHLSGRGMIDLGESSFQQHVPMSFQPRRKFFGVMSPMSDGGFVTPVQQFAHGAAMRAAFSVSIHRGLVVPGRDGPEDISRIAQDFAAEKTGAALCLARGIECFPHKFRKIDVRANPQPRHGNKCHVKLPRYFDPISNSPQGIASKYSYDAVFTGFNDSFAGGLH